MDNAPAEIIQADTLASFETEVPAVAVVPVRWSYEKHAVAVMVALEGKTKTAIAKELGIPLSAINTWLKHPEFQAYIDQIVTEGALKLKNKKLQLLMKTLAAREEEAEKDGYSSFSRKDSLDIIAEIRKETGEEHSADSSYTSLLEQLVLKSVTPPTKIITVEDVPS